VAKTRAPVATTIVESASPRAHFQHPQQQQQRGYVLQGQMHFWDGCQVSLEQLPSARPLGAFFVCRLWVQKPGAGQCMYCASRPKLKPRLHKCPLPQALAPTPSAQRAQQRPPLASAPPMRQPSDFAQAEEICVTDASLAWHSCDHHRTPPQTQRRESDEAARWVVRHVTQL
jgi:hypothetical protein